jgi:hypothetical protein
VSARRAVLALPAAAAAAAAIAAGGASAEPGVTAAAACTVNDATLEYNGQDGAAGTLVEGFRYVKRGGGRCSLTGFPKVTLLRKSGRALPIRVRRSGKRPVRRVSLRSGKPVYFEVRHPSSDPDTSAQCSTRVWGFRVKTPGFSKDLDLELSSPLRFCDKGARKTAFGRRPA